ncbi:hypothetical protein Dsin_019923 [Dipteronia sinensis]|uniref:Disease resistance R13L4/SHOC-2-like LRR domain-containing protein n=1 Tax=Dipteronia sinensis TaxID=43782 RepID=A0AAE0A886_9ROSI|nr:hypothetical protein Dsin_019923 [Dipteronia sinensis]
MFKKLRVLSLRKYHINKLPDSIGELRYLGYFNLAHTEIASFPDSIKDLFSLQVLILRNCSRMSRLPPEAGTLINLRHLDIGGIKSITEMPSGMQELKYLQTLSDTLNSSKSSIPVVEYMAISFTVICVTQQLSESRPSCSFQFCICEVSSIDPSFSCEAVISR